MALAERKAPNRLKALAQLLEGKKYKAKARALI